MKDYYKMHAKSTVRGDKVENAINQAIAEIKQLLLGELK